MVTVTERVSRLTGDGRTDERGGGLPLVDLFQPILRTIHDNGPQPLSGLIEAVQAGFIGRKDDRLRFIYRTEGDPWPAFLTDAVEQLVAVGLLRERDDRWELTAKFKLDTKLTVIPQNGPYERITVKVASEAVRAARAAETIEVRIRSLATDLDEHRLGMRRRTPEQEREHVENLKKSMVEYGFVSHFPVIKDDRGRILDGRHRAQAAEELGIPLVEGQNLKTLHGITDREALAVALVGNLHSTEWNAEELDAIRGALGGTHPAKKLGMRVLVRDELQRDPRRSDLAIAKMLGFSHTTVATCRAEMRAEGVDVRTADEVKRDAVAEVVKADPDASDREIARRAGVADHKMVPKVRRELRGGDCNGLSIAPTEELTPIQQAIKREAEADPDASYREIARRAGTDESAVRRNRKKLGLSAKPASGSTPVLVSTPPDLAEQIIKVFGADRLVLIEACQQVIKILEEERY